MIAKEPMYIETKNLTKRFENKTAVDSVSLEVEEGIIYGLVGKNGAGKTTLMKMLTGLVVPTSGEILHKEKLQAVGVLIEEPGLYPNRTCFENLRIKMMACGTYSKEKCSHILQIVGLSDSENLKAKKLSLGMKQRLGLAMGLATGSDLLILDEPMNGLDPDGMIEFRKILAALKHKGMTILISSHLLSELDKIADVFGFMSNGKLVKVVKRNETDQPLEQIYLEVTKGLKK